MTSGGPFQPVWLGPGHAIGVQRPRVLLGPACWVSSWFLPRCKCLLNLSTCGPCLHGPWSPSCSPFPSVAGRVCLGRG